MEGPENYIDTYNIPYTFPLRKCFLVCLCFMITMSGEITHQFFFCQKNLSSCVPRYFTTSSRSIHLAFAYA